jgi:hypothetical protein
MTRMMMMMMIKCNLTDFLTKFENKKKTPSEREVKHVNWNLRITEKGNNISLKWKY